MFDNDTRAKLRGRRGFDTLGIKGSGLKVWSVWASA